MNFNHKSWNLREAVDALFAYDMGATDSGIKDEDLKKEVEISLNTLSINELQNFINTMYKAPCYGEEDKEELIRWMKSELDVENAWKLNLCD